MANNGQVDENQKAKSKNGWKIAFIILISLIIFIFFSSWIFNNLGGSSISYLEDSSQPNAPSSSSKSSNFGSSNLSYSQTESDESESSQESAERMIIKESTLSMVVSDIDKTINVISSYVENKNGYVSSSNIYNPLDQPRSTITLRVPSSALDESIEYFKTLADKIVSETLSSDDITDQYTDLAAKLKNYESAENQFQEIMKKASNIEEILKVQNQLINVRENIELVKGQMEYLDKNVEMSKITITLAIDEASLPVVSEKWRPWVQVKSAFRAVLSVLRWLSYAIIWVVIFGIIWLPARFIIKWRKKIKDQKPKIKN